MQKMLQRETNLTSPKLIWLVWLTGIGTSLLLSAKWLVPAAAWIAPACFLFFIQFKKGRIKWCWLFLGLFISQALASVDVAPLPLPVLLIITLINTALASIIYALHYWVSKRSDHFITTLVFPSAWVAMEYYNSFGGAGVWGNMANTQFTFSYLAQLASVTGIWGISFLVYWWNALFVWGIHRWINYRPYKTPLAIFGSLFLLTMIYGISRYHFGTNENQFKKIKVSGIALSQLDNMESMYKEVTGKKINIDPAISQTSPQLQEFNKAFIKVIENPDSLKFPKTIAGIYQFNDSLFTLTKSAADKGAQLVLWAEANSIIYPQHEAGLIEKGKAVAKEKNIYLLMAYAVLHPGKIIPGKKFMENKTVFAGPDGTVLNIFYKNKPVPFAENSIEGDGRIPVINTALGKASVSICYDADFPALMKQLSVNKSDFLLLPSGDWFAITPHHTYMAVYRAIENGCPLIRNVKGGLSVATDYKGKIYSSSNFYDAANKQWIFELPTGHVNTIYSVLGDAVPYFSILILTATIVLLISNFIKRNFLNKN